ncbi:hypothetical protein [Dyella mobilis]|nr:hypothetical protein [Dyella mobilis]
MVKILEALASTQSNRDIRAAIMKLALDWKNARKGRQHRAY